MNYLFLSILCLLSFYWPDSTQTENNLVNINISQIRSNSGVIKVQVFTDEASFKKSKPFKNIAVSKDHINKGSLSAKINLPNGTYGIAILDDENNNGKMDYGLMMPKEGFGFSNYYLTGMKRPVFDDFKFSLNNANVSVIIKTRYL